MANDGDVRIDLRGGTPLFWVMGPTSAYTYYSARPVNCVSFTGLLSPFLSRCRPEGRAECGPARPPFGNLLTEFQRLHQR